MKFLFAVEHNLTLLAGNDEKRRYLISDEGNLAYTYNNENRLTSIFEIMEAKSLAMVDQWAKINIDIGQKEPGNFWVFPLETVSQSESGYELTYQGSTILLVKEVLLDKLSEKQYKFTLGVKEI
jgi:4-alpha-glucanotransferase